jgi:two-component system cell cycle response regulator
MKARILFFDDEPQTSVRLKLTLEKQGYAICTPASVDEALHEINLNGAEVLIHSAHRTKTHWDLVEGILNVYPHFPSLHFATGPLAESFQKVRKGPFHQKLRPLVPERDFLRRVRKLIFVGRLQRENQALKKSLSLHKRAELLFNSLDITQLRRQIVDFFGHEFKAQQAVFLAPGAYGYFLQEMWKVKAITAGPGDTQNNSHTPIISFEPTDEEKLNKFLIEASTQLPRDWELHRERILLSTTATTEQVHCLIPLMGHQSAKILGHVLLINPLLLGDPGLERSMNHLLQVMGRHLEHVTNFSGAKNLNYIDDLTELFNQRYLKLVIDREINLSSRSKSAFSVLFMDIDHFKKVNDSKGHIVGSKVLIELSKVLHKNIRAVDYGFRYGGDEFILILVGAGTEQSFMVAERIRKNVEETVFDIDGIQIKVTLSIGVATFPDHATTREQIIELADRAMYCGKNKSRNVVFVAS